MKRVLVTPSFSDDGKRIQINHDYMQAIQHAGALPVLLPLLTKPEEWEAALDNADGIVFSGGADVHPSSYGEETLPCCGSTMIERDVMEIGLCRLALARDLPMLAICRGHQILNVTLGGSLYQDIATQFGAELRHPVYERPAEQVHQVKLEPGCKLAQITGLKELSVNSRHHQAIHRLGEGLVVTAHATDGLIEGVELPGKRFVVGVQWHPESLAPHVPDAAKLFEAFVAAL